MRKLFAKILRTLAVVAVILFGFFLWAYYSPLFTVADLSIEGTTTLAPEELLNLTSIEPGRNQLQIDLKKEASNLVSHPLVAEAELARFGFKGILLKVREELPVLIVEAQERFGLSLEGRVLPYQLCEGISPLPILSAPGVSLTPLQKLRPPHLLYALDFYRKFLKVRPLWARKISKISFSDGGELLITLGLRPLTVNFGRGMFSEKIHRLLFILEENLYSVEKIRSIDLRVSDQVIVFREGD